MSNLPRDALTFPNMEQPFLEPYLPQNNTNNNNDNDDHDHDDDKKNEATVNYDLPFTTLTFATSLDSSLALSPGARTILSGPQSKAMTHYLRSRHDAILIGVGTAVADDPGLNCRLGGVGGYGSEGLQGQPRPIVVDPSARWDFTEHSKILILAREGRGRAPYIVTGLQAPPPAKKELLERHGGKYIPLDCIADSEGQRFDWAVLLQRLKKEGLSSVMIEGGGSIINSLLEPSFQHLINSVIVTIAPTWLGQGGVVVSPKRRFDKSGTAMAASRLTDVQWHPFGEDVVLCGRVKD